MKEIMKELTSTTQSWLGSSVGEEMVDEGALQEMIRLAEMDLKRSKDLPRSMAMGVWAGR